MAALTIYLYIALSIVVGCLIDYALRVYEQMRENARRSVRRER